MADWLKERGLKSIAMESTVVYWIPPFEILEERVMRSFERQGVFFILQNLELI